MKKTPLFASLVLDNESHAQAEYRAFLLLVLVFMVCSSGFATGTYNNNATADGSPGNPYEIATAEQLDELGQHSEDWAKCFVLTADIDLSNYDGQDGHPEFHRIGISRYTGAFSGIFDGAGHTISNLTLNLPGTSYVGLFGCVEGDDEEVKNVRLVNVAVSAVGDVGGLIGWNGGAVSNCSSKGSVTGTGNWIGGLIGENSVNSITDCYSTGTVSGVNNVGGLVGQNEGASMINNCYFSGHVEGGQSVGGLLGISGGLETSNCYSSGYVEGTSMVGGLVGGNQSQILNCYSTSSVSGDQNIGGLLGYNWGTIVESFWDIETSGTTLGTGGGSPAGVEGKMTENMQTQSTFAGWDFSTPVWMMLRELEDYPRLAWQEVFAGDIAGLYGADLVDFAYLANYWGLNGCNTGTDCGRADIDGLGVVGLTDLAAVANDWLK